MSYRTAEPGPLIGQDVDLATFRFFLVLGSLLVASIMPTMVFGVILNQWGSNLIWGSLYGLGWCVASSSSETLSFGMVASLGIAWAWGVPLLLYFFTGWLWPRVQPAARRKVMIALIASFFLCVPAKTMLAIEQAGVHLPDFSLHLATSYP